MTRICVAMAWVGAALVATTAADPPQSTVYRASALYGLPFVNANNETLGKLHDIVVDEKGKVVYGVLSAGGVAGVGDRLLAVPLDTLKTLSKDPARKDKNYFTVTVSKATLDGQPGFNEKDYPAAPNPLFMKGDAATTTRRDAATSDRTIHRLRALVGTPVRNQAGEDCGKVRDFGVTLDDGAVSFAFIGYGGAVGLGEKSFAARWKAMELKSLTGKPADVSFVVHVSKQTLDQSSGIANNGFPNDKDLDVFKRDGK